jgi:hypothetical protein
MKRREMLKRAAIAAAGLSALPWKWAAAAERKRKKVLYFTRSAGFVHSVVRRNGSALSHSEKVLTEMGNWRGIDVDCTQDGTVFDGDLDQYDAIAFYTSGDLCKPGGTGKPMTPSGKAKLLDAVLAGKGFLGFHACTDSFHSHGRKLDPYTAMLGAEFLTHGPQQEASLAIVSHFPGMQGLSMAEGISFYDEWYVQKNFGSDLHVILVQETGGMQGDCYRRPDYPCTWARMHGKGRVFYTSLGHREDIWTNPFFQAIVMGGLAWALGNVQHDVKPNISRVTPKANA